MQLLDAVDALDDEGHSDDAIEIKPAPKRSKTSEIASTLTDTDGGSKEAVKSSNVAKADDPTLDMDSPKSNNEAETTNYQGVCGCIVFSFIEVIKFWRLCCTYTPKTVGLFA